LWWARSAPSSVAALAEVAGLPRAVILSIAPKSVTGGVAMGISETLRADPSLTMVSVILTCMHRARLPGRYRGRRVRGYRHGPERVGDIPAGASRRDASGEVIAVAVRFCAVVMALRRKFF